jgi:hypothetical protein
MRWWTLWLLFHQPMDKPQQKSATNMAIRLSTSNLPVMAPCAASWAVNMIWCQNSPRKNADVTYQPCRKATMHVVKRIM